MTGGFWRIETLGETPSTQDIARARAAQGEAEGLAVRAASQSAGHGRHGRRWISAPGNLHASLLLRPACKAAEVGQLAILSGLAAARVAGRFTAGGGRGLSLKWPNDVLLDGRKCGGILLESALGPDGDVEWVVAGIGLNAAHAPEGAESAAIGCEAEPLFTALLEEFGALYENWKTGGFAAVRRGWLALAHRPGDYISVKVGLDIRSGTFHSIDEFGNLILRDTALQLQTITAGDVYPARA